MSSTFIIAIVIIVLLIILVAWFIHAYNSLVRTRNMVGNQWAQIDVQLKQRADLVPNLVATVKGYATHESQTFEKVTQARAAATQATTVAQRSQAEGELSKALVNMLATAEAYPELKANQNFLDLQAQLKDLESKIAYARQFYNDIVLKYNNQLQTFPSNLVAGMFHFSKSEFFAANDTDRAVPTVSFQNERPQQTAQSGQNTPPSQSAGSAQNDAPSAH